jgi:fructose 1,6-bisphosphatase
MTRTGIGSPIELSISPEKVVFLMEKAKEFDAKDVPTKEDPGSNPSDDRMIEVLEDHPDDPVLMEIAGLINSLNEDEQIDLVALMWMGRDDYSVEEWTQLRAEAARAHNKHTARYLAGTPLLADFLAAGLDRLGYDVAELESEAFR